MRERDEWVYVAWISAALAAVGFLFAAAMPEAGATNNDEMTEVAEDV